MQKTKVRAIVSLLDFAGASLQRLDFAVASDTARVNYFDTQVKPFSRIETIEFDIAMYSLSPLATDAFIDFAVWKDVGGNTSPIDPTATPISMVPYIFRIHRAALPLVSATQVSIAVPAIYHLQGRLKIPPRFQVMAPGDKLSMTFKGFSGAFTYSVNGQITYMFKV